MAMEEVEVVLKRFGDEQSTLLDRFERLSFEVQLNRAILGRSLSEPRTPRYEMPPPPPPPVESKVSEGRRHHHQHHRLMGFQKALKRLFKAISISNSRKQENRESIPFPDQKNFKFIKAFSRSVRV